jgi:predicted ArsR family transcriptional regulator
LAGALLDQLARQADAEQFAQLLGQLADQLASQMATLGNQAGAASRAGENLTLRLYRATEILNQRHYQARWEAHPDAPRLLLMHCPFSAILEEHPEMCQLDAYLIERLTGAPAEQTAKRIKDPSGLRYCKFRIGQERV